MEVKNKKRQPKRKSMLIMDNLPVFSTIGLVSSSPLHKIAWQLNETFAWNLEANIELSEYLQLPGNALVYVGKDKKNNVILLLPPFVKSSTKLKKSNKNKLLFDYLVICTRRKNDEVADFIAELKKLSILQYVSIYPDSVPFTDDWLVLI